MNEIIKDGLYVNSDGHIQKWYQHRINGRVHRHEVFYGTANRKKSIKYGLVVYLEPEDHNMSSYGVHFNIGFDRYLKESAQKSAMEYYGWDEDEFRKIFGKSYI